MILLETDLKNAALRGVALGVARADDGKILYATPLLESMFGYTMRGALMNDKHVEDLVPMEARNRHIQHRANYAAQPSTRPMGIGLNAHGLRADGTLFPVFICLYSEVISNSVCIVFVVIDMSALIQSPIALDKMNIP